MSLWLQPQPKGPVLIQVGRLSWGEEGQSINKPFTWAIFDDDAGFIMGRGRYTRVHAPHRSTPERSALAFPLPGSPQMHQIEGQFQGPDRGEPRRPLSIGRCRRSTWGLASQMRKRRCQIDKSSREWLSGVDVGPLAKPLLGEAPRSPAPRSA